MFVHRQQSSPSGHIATLPLVVLLAAVLCNGACVVGRSLSERVIVGTNRRIDRFALVTRHNIELRAADPLTPLSVGNGEFAFTADITGLQTFPEFHAKGMPLGTQSPWGWHSLPNSEGYELSDVLDAYIVSGRKVRYASNGRFSDGYSPAGTWLRSNPHRLHLGQIGLGLLGSDGSEGRIEDLHDETHV